MGKVKKEGFYQKWKRELEEKMVPKKKVSDVEQKMIELQAEKESKKKFDMSIFHETIESNRYHSNFKLEIQEAERFEAMHVDDLTRDEITGERQPYVVEWFIAPGKICDTFEVNADTLDDKWEVVKEASVELQVVVFKNEEEKKLYLQSKTKN